MVVNGGYRKRFSYASYEIIEIFEIDIFGSYCRFQVSHYYSAFEQVRFCLSLLLRLGFC